MELTDGMTLGQLAVRLGLISEDQFRQAVEEAGSPNPATYEMLRILERRGWLTQWQSARLIRGDTLKEVLLGGEPAPTA